MHLASKHLTMLMSVSSGDAKSETLLGIRHLALVGVLVGVASSNSFNVQLPTIVS